MVTLARAFVVHEDARYTLQVPELALELDYDRVRRERGSIHGELAVSTGMPGTRSSSGMLFAGNFNASSLRDRRELATHLERRSAAADVNWLDLLEDLCERVVAAEREGRPPVLLRDVDRPPLDDVLEVLGLRLLRRQPVIAFGDGGTGKSYLAMAIGAELERQGVHVLYADWEFSGEDHRDRLERITGPDMPPMLYVRCERPMTAEADRLARIVRDHRVDYVIADSVAFAADGPPEAAEVAAAYFRAVRQLRVGSLHIAHMTKAEQGDQKPFGSTFWHNGARSTWYVKRSSDVASADRLDVALFHRKSNTGPQMPAVGLRLTFAPDRTTIERTHVADVPDLAPGLTIRERMAHLLRVGAMTVAEIAQELEEDVESVNRVARRYSGEGRPFVKVAGSDGIYRIGLASRPAA